MNLKQKFLVLIINEVSHIAGKYVIGARKDEWLESSSSTASSIIFVLALSLWMTEKMTNPDVLGELSQAYVYIYYILSGQFLTSLGLRLVWLPFRGAVSSFNGNLANYLKELPMCNVPPMSIIIYMLQCSMFNEVELVALALIFLYYTLKVTGLYPHVIEMLNNNNQPAPIIEPVQNHPENNRREPSAESFCSNWEIE